MLSEKEIITHYLSKDLDAESRHYISTHAKRFSYLIRFIKSVRASLPNAAVVMDIGPGFFTEILQINLPGDEIHTLGFDHLESRGGHFPAFIQIDKDRFSAFDLNNSQYPEKWIRPAMADIVVMGEVLEHLYTSPVHIFRFISSFMKPGGYLVLGTPNAVALQKRLTLLSGRNPYEQIRESRDNPGHFREYTVPELKQLARDAGLETHAYEIKNYFKRSSRKGVLYDQMVGAILPASFRTGINIVFRKV